MSDLSNSKIREFAVTSRQLDVTATLPDSESIEILVRVMVIAKFYFNFHAFSYFVEIMLILSTGQP